MFNLKVCSECYQKKDKTNFLSKDIIKAICNDCKKKKWKYKKKSKNVKKI